MNGAPGKKRFWWGVLLAWTPWVPTLIGLVIVFNNQKATGIAAVAGGVGELLVVWGLITMVVSQGVAIVWLFRSFSRDDWTRNVLSVISICMSGLMLLIVGFFVWMVWFHTRYHD